MARYTAEQKLMIEAIKGNFLRWIDCGDSILLVDGFKGCYIKKENLIINLKSIKQADDTSRKYQPEIIEKNTYPARKSDDARIIGTNIAIKIIASDGKYAYVRRDWLQDFGKYTNLRIGKNERDPVLVQDIKGNCIGVICTVRIGDKKDE